MKTDKKNIHSVVLLLPWYFMRRLKPTERKKVEKHLATCVSCRQELKMEYQIYEGVQRYFSSLSKTMNPKMKKDKHL